MALTWVVRILVLIGGFAVHWALGLFLVVGLYFHMKRKAQVFDQRYNLGGTVRGPDGRYIRAPWYRF